MNYSPIASALKEIAYNGYLSAEAFAWPDSRTAAEQTIREVRAVSSMVTAY